MYTKAYHLLEKEFRELEQNNYEGIKAFPVSEDMLKWEVEIEGQQNSICHGLVFHLTITFTPEYNLVPPVVKFTTIPFHPNVNPYTGQPSIDFLDNPDKWNMNYTLSSILLALQVMLSNPMLENPVNMEAAQLIAKDAMLYKTVIQRLFRKPSQAKGDNQELTKDQDKLIRAIKSVSFNDYYKTWSGIATSKASEYYRTPLLEDPSFIGQYHKRKKTDLEYSKEWKLKYAATKSLFTRKKEILHKVSVEKDHLFPSPIDQLSAETEIGSVENTREPEELWKISPESSDLDESWEEEVDDLVAWTHALNMEFLDN